jgi:hypothetical protein
MHLNLPPKANLIINSQSASLSQSEFHQQLNRQVPTLIVDTVLTRVGVRSHAHIRVGDPIAWGRPSKTIFLMLHKMTQRPSRAFGAIDFEGGDDEVHLSPDTMKVRIRRLRVFMNELYGKAEPLERIDIFRDGRMYGSGYRFSTFSQYIVLEKYPHEWAAMMPLGANC